jgi:hypothetical protein
VLYVDYDKGGFRRKMAVGAVVILGVRRGSEGGGLGWAGRVREVEAGLGVVEPNKEEVREPIMAFAVGGGRHRGIAYAGFDVEGGKKTELGLVGWSRPAKEDTCRTKREKEKARETERDEVRRVKGHGGATNNILQRHGRASPQQIKSSKVRAHLPF